VGRLLELSGQVCPGVVQDLVPSLPPVEALGHVVDQSKGGWDSLPAVRTTES